MNDITRRSMVLSAAAAALVAGAASLETVSSASARTRSVPKPLYYFDLTPLYSANLSIVSEANRVYDTLHLVAALQGLVNRTEATLYVNWVIDDGFYLAVQGATGSIPSVNVDTFWLDKLRAPGAWLADRTLVTLATLDDVLAQFSDAYTGYVVWDPAVPATSNVATTACGVDALLPLRYDTAATSLHAARTAAEPGSVALSFVTATGGSLFTGSGTIPGTSLASSGSAKNDAYRWAKAKYLDTGKCTPGILGYYVDGYALQKLPGLTGKVVNGITLPATTAAQLMLLTNLDYQVSRKSFVFDLSPWDTEAPNDDPTQAVGTDFATLQSILQTAYTKASAGLGLLEVSGFTPWYFKYCADSLGASGAAHGAVDTEWRFSEVLSAYNGYTDSDAWAIDGMANASLYNHFPLDAQYTQQNWVSDAELQARGFLDAAGHVVAKRYLMVYCGDYDSSAWTYRMIARYWNDPGRGQVDINWAFNPNLSTRAGHALHYARHNASSRDYFISGNSGAGYVNPHMLETPRAFSGLPSGVAAWKYHNQVQYAKWGLAVTGFVINGSAGPMSDTLRAEYADFSPVGIVEQDLPAAKKVAGVPFAPMTLTTAYAADAGAWLISLQFKPNPAYVGVPGVTATDEAPAGVEFYVARTVVQSPTWHKDCAAAMVRDRPRAAVEFVDAKTYFALLKKTL